MSQSAKVAWTVIGAVVAVFLVLKVLGFIVSTIMGLLIPIAILGGIGLGVYMLVSRSNSLPGGRRYLP